MHKKLCQNWITHWRAQGSTIYINHPCFMLLGLKLSTKLVLCCNASCRNNFFYRHLFRTVCVYAYLYQIKTKFNLTFLIACMSKRVHWLSFFFFLFDKKSSCASWRPWLNKTPRCIYILKTKICNYYASDLEISHVMQGARCLFFILNDPVMRHNWFPISANSFYFCYVFFYV